MRKGFVFLLLLLAGCVPKEQIVLRGVNVKEVGPGKAGLLLKADAVFYNPNNAKMKLKRIDIDVLVDGKKSAAIDQHLSAEIKAKSEFTVPLEVQIMVGESGIVDTILSFIGGKKHEVHFLGKLKITVNGFPVRVPIDYKDEVKF